MFIFVIVTLFIIAGLFVAGHALANGEELKVAVKDFCIFQIPSLALVVLAWPLVLQLLVS